MPEQRDDEATRKTFIEDGDRTFYTSRLVDDDGTEKRGSEVVFDSPVELDTEPPPPPPPSPAGDEE
jgi:hypothetical protein